MPAAAVVYAFTQTLVPDLSVVMSVHDAPVALT